MTVDEEFIDDRPALKIRLVNSRMSQGTTKPNSLDILIKTSVPKAKEVAIDYIVDPFDQDTIHLLQEVMTGGIPLYGRYLYESLRDDVKGVTRKFPCSCPVKGLVPVRGPLVRRSLLVSPVCHSNYIIYTYHTFGMSADLRF